MKNIYKILELNSLINHDADGYCAFFDPKNSTFQYLDASDPDSVDYFEKYETENKTTVYQMPFERQCKSNVWKIFYRLLNEEESKIARAYPYTKGFFHYVHEIGLGEKYDEALDINTYSIIKDIESNCGVKMDFSKLTIS